MTPGVAGSAFSSLAVPQVCNFISFSANPNWVLSCQLLVNYSMSFGHDPVVP